MKTVAKPNPFLAEKFLTINPHAKGNLGKSTAVEDHVSHLDYQGVEWLGSDLDDTHRTFAKRHPGEVESYTFGDAVGAKDALMAIHDRTRHNSAPVHVVDCRAQAHTFIMAAMQELDFFELCRDDNIQVTLFLFLSDELESMESIRSITKLGKDFAKIIVVENPVKSAGRLFHGSDFEKWLVTLGSGRIKMPTISTKTLLGMQGAEKRAGRGISFAEFATPGSGHLAPSMVKDIQWHLKTMYEQFDKNAHLMLPDSILSKLKMRKDRDTVINDSAMDEDDFGFAV